MNYTNFWEPSFLCFILLHFSISHSFLCFEFLTPNSVNFASSRSVHISPSYFLFTPSSPSFIHWIISLLRSPAPIFNSFLNDQFTPPLSYLVNFSILIPTFLSILFPPSNPIYPLIRISAPSIVPFLSPTSYPILFIPFILSPECSSSSYLARAPPPHCSLVALPSANTIAGRCAAPRAIPRAVISFLGRAHTRARL